MKNGRIQAQTTTAEIKQQGDRILQLMLAGAFVWGVGLCYILTVLAV